MNYSELLITENKPQSLVDFSIFISNFVSPSGEKVGFLFYFNLEYCGMAHAHELLHQDSEFNRADTSEETAGERASRINQKVRFRYTMKCVIIFAVPLARWNLKLFLKRLYGSYSKTWSYCFFYIELVTKVSSFIWKV